MTEVKSDCDCYSDAAAAVMQIFCLTVTAKRKPNTKARNYMNPCFDLWLCSQALRLWVEVSQIRFLFKMPNLIHHSRES